MAVGARRPAAARGALRRDRDHRSARGGAGAPGGRDRRRRPAAPVRRGPRRGHAPDRSAPALVAARRRRARRRRPRRRRGRRGPALQRSRPGAHALAGAASATVEPDRALVTGPRSRRTHPGVDPLVRGRRWMGRRRDGDAADRGHDHAAAGEPGRDPLRPGQRARQHRHPGRQRGPTARHGRGRVGRPGVGPPGRDRPGGPDPLRVEVAALRGAGPELRLPGPVDRLDLVGPPRTVDVGRHPAHRVRHGALEHVRWAAPPGRPGQRRRVDRPALVARRSPAAAGPRHRHGGRSWAVHPTPVVRATGPLVADRGGRRLWLVGAGQHLRRPRRSAPARDARGGDAHPRGGGLGGHRLPRGADGQPLLRVPGDALDRRSRHADHVAEGRDRPGPQRGRRGHALPRRHPLRERRQPTRRLRPRLRPGHRAGRTGRRRPDGPSGLRSHQRPRRPGSPRSIGAKRGVLATHRGEGEIVVGRTSWGG